MKERVVKKGVSRLRTKHPRSTISCWFHRIEEHSSFCPQLIIFIIPKNQQWEGKENQNAHITVLELPAS